MRSSRFLVPVFILTICPSLYCKTFETKNGSTFDAEIIGAYGSTMYVKMDKGGNGSIDIRALKKDDIDYVIQWAKDYQQVRLNLPLVKDSSSELSKFLMNTLYRMDSDKLEKYAFEEVREPEFYAFYSSASWCGPCRAFSPKLVDFYYVQKELMKRGNFEIILLSSDDGTSSMRNYMREEKMKWPTVKHSKSRDKIFKNFRGSGIPCLVVTDRHGNVLKHTYVRGQYEGPSKTLQFLKELLDLTNALPTQDDSYIPE